MTLIKNEIPILEYDDEQTAVIMPDRDRKSSFPERAVFPFLYDEVDKYAEQNHCRQIGEFISATKIYPIFVTEVREKQICLCQAPVGAPAAVQIMDYLIGYGVKKIISAGSCGTLKDLPENEFLVPVEALRCEGTSYHYLPPARTVSVSPAAVAAIETALKENGIRCRRCRTWTTDGFFRETKEIVGYRKSEGFDTVEMECASLAACAKFRKAVFGQILFTADTLANVESHEDRNWGLDSFSPALKICLDAAAVL